MSDLKDDPQPIKPASEPEVQPSVLELLDQIQRKIEKLDPTVSERLAKIEALAAERVPFTDELARQVEQLASRLLAVEAVVSEVRGDLTDLKVTGAQVRSTQEQIRELLQVRLLRAELDSKDALRISKEAHAVVSTVLTHVTATEETSIANGRKLDTILKRLEPAL